MIDRVKYNQPRTGIDPELIYRGRGRIIASWPPHLAKDVQWHFSLHTNLTSSIK